MPAFTHQIHIVDCGVSDDRLRARMKLASSNCGVPVVGEYFQAQARRNLPQNVYGPLVIRIIQEAHDRKDLWVLGVVSAPDMDAGKILSSPTCRQIAHSGTRKGLKIEHLPYVVFLTKKVQL